MDLDRAELEGLREKEREEFRSVLLLLNSSGKFPNIDAHDLVNASLDYDRLKDQWQKKSLTFYINKIMEIKEIQGKKGKRQGTGLFGMRKNTSNKPKLNKSINVLKREVESWTRNRKNNDMDFYPVIKILATLMGEEDVKLLDNKHFQ